MSALKYFTKLEWGNWKTREREMGWEPEQEQEFMQKAACCTSRNETTSHKDLAYKISRDKSDLMMILYMNKGAQRWTSSFTYCLVLWTQQSRLSWIDIGSYQKWVHIPTLTKQ